MHQTSPREFHRPVALWAIALLVISCPVIAQLPGGPVTIGINLPTSCIETLSPPTGLGLENSTIYKTYLDPLEDPASVIFDPVFDESMFFNYAVGGWNGVNTPGINITSISDGLDYFPSYYVLFFEEDSSCRSISFEFTVGTVAGAPLATPIDNEILFGDGYICDTWNLKIEKSPGEYPDFAGVEKTTNNYVDPSTEIEGFAHGPKNHYPVYFTIDAASFAAMENSFPYLDNDVPYSTANIYRITGPTQFPSVFLSFHNLGLSQFDVIGGLAINDIDNPHDGVLISLRPNSPTIGAWVTLPLTVHTSTLVPLDPADVLWVEPALNQGLLAEPASLPSIYIRHDAFPLDAGTDITGFRVSDPFRGSYGRGNFTGTLQSPGLPQWPLTVRDTAGSDYDWSAGAPSFIVDVSKDIDVRLLEPGSPNSPGSQVWSWLLLMYPGRPFNADHYDILGATMCGAPTYLGGTGVPLVGNDAGLGPITLAGNLPYQASWTIPAGMTSVTIQAFMFENTSSGPANYGASNAVSMRVHF